MSPTPRKYTLMDPEKSAPLVFWVLAVATLSMGLLKEFGLLDWSWWVVFLPVLAYLGIVALVMFAVLALIGFGDLYHWWRRRK